MSGDYSIGHYRLKYLDLANMSFSQGDYVGCKGHIDSFLETVKDDSEAGKLFKKEFDDAYKQHNNIIFEAEQRSKDLDHLAKKDFLNGVKDEASINLYHDLKTICWKISLDKGLFND